MRALSEVVVNVEAFVDQGVVGDTPWRVDRDGRPYVPVGDGGVVRGVRLGDPAYGRVGDHVAPGACLVHPVTEARHAVAALACLGNRVEVRTGAAAGERGRVLGKRGGGERVIAVFTPEVLAALRPGDRVSVTTRGQGSSAPVADLTQMNLDPAAAHLLGTTVASGRLVVSVRTVVASAAVGYGIGRPMASWDLDLQLPGTAAPQGLRLGDLVAVTDLDARWNAGYRRGYVSVGVVVHGDSPEPGHGPGLTVLWSGPSTSLDLREDPLTHAGLTEETLLSWGEGGD